LSQRLTEINWHLFRGVYTLDRYPRILGIKEVKFLGQFQPAFAIDDSGVALSQKLEAMFQSLHHQHASLRLNTEYSLKVAAVTKLQVGPGRRHENQFSFVTHSLTVSIGSTWAIGLSAE
jgi:hypothetical protein